MAVPETNVALSKSAIKDVDVDDSTGATRPNVDIWSKFFTRCLAKRVKKDQFEELALELYYHAPFTGRKIVDALFGLYQEPPLVIDPLIMPYIEGLLESSRVSCADLLSSLFDRSRYSPLTSTNGNKDGQGDEMSKVLGSLTTMEHLIVDLITRAIYSGKRPSTPEEGKAILRATTKWASALSNAANIVLHGMDSHFGLICDSLGLLAIACFENLKMIDLIDNRLSKGMFAGNSILFVESSNTKYTRSLQKPFPCHRSFHHYLDSINNFAADSKC
jgi:hypothetical protein